MHVHFMQMSMSERVAASPGNSLLAKALLCTLSGVKAGRVQDRAATSRVCREMCKCFCGYQWAFLINRIVT